MRILHFLFTIFLFVIAFNLRLSADDNPISKCTCVIFIQSDLIPDSESDKNNFIKIWDEIVKELYYKICENKNKISKIFLYPLNKNTKDAILLSDIDHIRLTIGTPYRVSRNFEESLEKCKIEHAKILESEASNIQDIIGSYTVLNIIKNNFTDVAIVKVIYISDMVHYQSRLEETDSENGIFNFANDYSLAQFESQINDSIINDVDGAIPIQPLLNSEHQQKLEIYSIFLSRDNRRDKISSSVRIKVDKVWHKFFSKMGASLIRLNLSINTIAEIFNNL